MADGPLAWQSVRWPCGSTYEGLVANELCHVRGVFRYPRGDRYEGEYEANQMTGYGVYVWSDGTVYRGQWKDSAMHGCGVKIHRQPNGQFLAEEGQFIGDEWVGSVMACTVDQARAAAAEADKAAMLARAFELEPEHASPGAAQQQAPAAKKKGVQRQQQQQVPIPPAGAPAAPVKGRDWAPLEFFRSMLPK